jgi:hypothetical protein
MKTNIAPEPQTACTKVVILAPHSLPKVHPQLLFYQFYPVTQLLRCAPLLGLAVLSACSGLGARKQERLNDYSTWSVSDQGLVNRGKIAPGMGTNAVYVAWGPPSEVVHTPATPSPQTVWIYYGSQPVLVPNWSYIPNDRGYWSLEYTPDHYSKVYTKGEVFFENDRVVKFLQF